MLVGTTGSIIVLALAALFANCSGGAVQSEKIYKMCIPEKFYQDCLDLLKDSGIHLECVKGRDRLDCLDLINQRKADVLAADPEDMYVAYYKRNEDYKVISEFRTQVEKDAEFRYEAVILVKKNSNIRSLRDLKGKKSCHTGYGRYSGYQVPITKLKNVGILRISMDPQYTPTERELKALSGFFSQSCLIGTYSRDAEIDQALKKKYPNLCALCEHPDKCNYPDKFSGFDGAIRCLDKRNGDVAFTKTYFVKKYFGMMPGVTAESSNPDDFEYLCEDGSRKNITGPTCSWAQRPWNGFLSNADLVTQKSDLNALQTNLEKFVKNGLKIENFQAAHNLLISSNLVYHKKETIVEPEVYLERAGYKDVIERDANAINKIRFCVTQDVEMRKCQTMHAAAFSRDIHPEIECVMMGDCMEAVRQGKADVMVAKGKDYQTGTAMNLNPVAFETIRDSKLYVVVVDPSLKKDIIMKSPVKFDANNERGRAAAALLNKRRGLPPCAIQSINNDQMIIVKANELKKYKNMQLLCPNLEKMPLYEVSSCNFEAAIPRSMLVSRNMDKLERDNVVHVTSLLSYRFGDRGALNDEFQMFGEYETGQNDVIFSDDGKSLETEWKNPNVDEKTVIELNCPNAISKS